LFRTINGEALHFSFRLQLGSGEQVRGKTAQTAKNMTALKTKDFGRAKVSLPLPYLLVLQKESWDMFWGSDLKELFREISPIKDYTGKEMELWIEDFKLDEPKYKNDWSDA